MAVSRSEHFWLTNQGSLYHGWAKGNRGSTGLGRLGWRTFSWRLWWQRVELQRRGGLRRTSVALLSCLRGYLSGRWVALVCELFQLREVEVVEQGIKLSLNPAELFCL